MLGNVVVILINSSYVQCGLHSWFLFYIIVWGFHGCCLNFIYIFCWDLNVACISLKVESTLRVSHLLTKKMMYNKYHDTQWVEILMTSFDYLNINKKIKNKKWRDKILKLKGSFWVKINLDPMVRWRGLDKINVHRVYNLHFLYGHMVSCLWYMKDYQTNEIWKINAMPIYKISPFWIWYWFFLMKKDYYAFIVKKMQKNAFLKEIESKNLKSMYGLRSISCIKKNSPNNST